MTDLNSTCAENKTHTSSSRNLCRIGWRWTRCCFNKAKGTGIGILYLIVTMRLFKVDLEERIFKYVLQGQP